VTDALAVLGLLPMDALAGGAIVLNRVAAHAALTTLAKALGLRDAYAAAAGVLAVANAHMEAALRHVSVERGEDPRETALVAFGGAGGLHACALAGALGARAVVWPRHAGVLCALGALEGGSRREKSRSVLRECGDTVALARELRALEREVRAAFPRAERARATLEAWAEVRSRGQAHELSVPAEPLATLAMRFHAAHERRYGFADRAREVEVVTLEVRGALAPPFAPERPARARRVRAVAGATQVHEGGRTRTAAVWTRASLAPGAQLRGPAVVLDEGATFWLPRGWTARVHASGALVAKRGRA
jgi:N-methylhydantoinase A